MNKRKMNIYMCPETSLDRWYEPLLNAGLSVVLFKESPELRRLASRFFADCPENEFVDDFGGLVSFGQQSLYVTIPSMESNPHIIPHGYRGTEITPVAEGRNAASPEFAYRVIEMLKSHGHIEEIPTSQPIFRQ